MENPETVSTAELWAKAFSDFEHQYPNVAEGMRVMNISFPQYLQALAAIRQVPTTSASSDT